MRINNKQQKRSVGIVEYYNFYKSTKKTRSEPIISKEIYKEVVSLFFRKLGLYLIHTGSKYYMPCGLGEVLIRRYDKRQKRNPDGSLTVYNIDWGASNKRKEEKGDYKYIMYTNSNYFVKWFWARPHRMYKAVRFYKFTATKGLYKTINGVKTRIFGMKEELSFHVRENKNNHLKYEYVKMKDEKKVSTINKK